MKKYAILIAVQQYADSNLPNVRYARNDAEAFSQALVPLGFEQTDQLLFINSQATKEALESKINQVIQRLQREDLLYFYYVGHGISQGPKNFITCHDTQDADRAATSVELGTIFQALQNAAGAQVVLFLDCHQGGIHKTPGQLGSDDRFQVHQLEAMLHDAPHCVCFAACLSNENSHSSVQLRHGVWAYHIIEALQGHAPLALQREILTAASLQSYLKSEVPHTLRKESPTPNDQTPWMYDAGDGETVLADLRSLIQQPETNNHPSHGLISQLSFKVEETARVRSLSGWKKSFRIPDAHTAASEEFAIRCAAEELKGDLDQVYDQLKQAFRFTRRKLDVTEPEVGFATIITPYFNYTVTVSLNPDELEEVIWTKTVDAIKVPEQLETEAFAQVFDNIFTTLELLLPASVDMENFIDQIEEADHPGVKIAYDREATYCQLHLTGTAGTVTLTADRLAIVHDRPAKTQQLIKSFDSVRKLIWQHDGSPASFTPAEKNLPRPG